MLRNGIGQVTPQYYQQNKEAILTVIDHLTHSPVLNDEAKAQVYRVFMRDFFARKPVDYAAINNESRIEIINEMIAASKAEGL